MRRGFTKGLRFTVDLSKITARENPRTIQLPVSTTGNFPEPLIVDWGDGNVEVISSGGGTGWNTHTYAAGAGDVFTVVVRCATGHFPYVRFAMLVSNASDDLTPTHNITLAVTSVDHFAGVSTTANASTGVGGSLFKEAANVKHVDPRLVGQNDYTSLLHCFTRSGIEQPLESFCLHFCTKLTVITSAFFGTSATHVPGDLFRGLEEVTKANGVFAYCPHIATIGAGLFDDMTALTDAGNMFSSCTSLTAIPENIFDKCVRLTSIANAFRTCSAVTSDPYVFWDENGDIDTTRFPNLTAGNASGVYAGCSGTLRAKVPQAYGGTA